MFCEKPACVKKHYVVHNAHKFEDLAVDKSALFHGSLNYLSFYMISAGDMEACVVSRDATNIRIAIL